MERTTSLILILVFVAVLCSAAAPDDDLGVVIQQGCTNFSAYLPKMDLDKPASLPCTRPAPYNYTRSLVMANWNGTAFGPVGNRSARPLAVSRKYPASGAVIWTLRHAPIFGVTPTMVRWMWNNMDKNVSDPRDPNGRKWQVFQLMHPSDHVGVTWNTIDLTTSPFPGDAPGNATKWVWTEIPASGCKINNTHMECPASQPGYTCKSITAAQLKRIATLNLSMVTSELTSAVEDGLELSVVTMRYFFNIKETGCTNVDLWRAFVEFRNVMRYRTNAKSMSVDTTWTVGYNIAAASGFNEPYLQPLWAGFTPGGDKWRLAVNYYIMHTLQEWAALPQWLPAVYKAETGL